MDIMRAGARIRTMTYYQAVELLQRGRDRLQEIEGDLDWPVQKSDVIVPIRRWLQEEMLSLNLSLSDVGDKPTGSDTMPT